MNVNVGFGDREKYQSIKIKKYIMFCVKDNSQQSFFYDNFQLFNGEWDREQFFNKHYCSYYSIY